MNCRKYQSTQIIEYEHTHYGKLRFRCRASGRQFVEDAIRQPINEVTCVSITLCSNGLGA
jgi:hypothetical protein